MTESRTPDFRKRLAETRRVVVKVGTSNLTDKDSRLDSNKIEKIVDEIMGLRKEGRDVILITSGAIGAGVGRMNLQGRPRQMPLLQAAAAVGQAILMQVYERDFAAYGQPIAQVLLTREDFGSEDRRKNLRNTIDTLLSWKVVPIINENDTVAVEEIKVSDNDLLSALVATNVNADLLLILSDVDGLYTGDPKGNAKRTLIRTVSDVNSDVEEIAGEATSGFGGMHTKIRAAKVVGERGIPCVVANGSERNVMKRVLAGEEIGTLFLPKRKP